MSLKPRPVLAALAAMLVLAGCGADATPAPARGPVSARVGERASADLLAVELLRARLVAASDLYGLGRREDAAAHLAAARRGYDGVSARVRAREPRIDFEIRVAFHLLERWMADGERPDRVRERIAPVGDQLTEGALGSLMPTAVRFDPGVQAEALRRLLDELGAAYGVAAPPPGDDRERRSYQRAYGLLDRGQVMARAVEDTLGPDRDPVLMPLAAVRFEAFPGGLGPRPAPVEGEPAPPAKPPAPAVVSGRLRGASAALARRFGL